jgi:hypothetical protein
MLILTFYIEAVIVNDISPTLVVPPESLYISISITPLRASPATLCIMIVLAVLRAVIEVANVPVTESPETKVRFAHLLFPIPVTVPPSCQ